MSAVSFYRVVRDWGRTRSLRRELERLSDRQLADIGLRREQIELVTAGATAGSERFPF
jgi:uncharacterized protein YjiS (DUF1127 family)